MPPTRIEWEWLALHAITRKKLVPFAVACRDSQLPGFNIMHRCRKCGRQFFNSCIDCDFRNGGTIPEEDRDEPDTVEGMGKMQSDPGYRLENTLRWMGVRWDE